jgi:hypothetical protein
MGTAHASSFPPTLCEQFQTRNFISHPASILTLFCFTLYPCVRTPRTPELKRSPYPCTPHSVVSLRQRTRLRSESQQRSPTQQAKLLNCHIFNCSLYQPSIWGYIKWLSRFMYYCNYCIVAQTCVVVLYRVSGWGRTHDFVGEEPDIVGQAHAFTFI